MSSRTVGWFEGGWFFQMPGLPALVMLPALAALTAAAMNSADLPIAGDWANDNRSVIVRIAPCANAICGDVRWSSEVAQADAARAGTHRLNGTRVVIDFVATRDSRWKGKLFVPDLGRTVRATIRQTGPDRLEVRGCELAGLICRTQKWSRVTPAS